MPDKPLKVGQVIVGALNYAPSSMVYMGTLTCMYSGIRHIQPVVLSISNLPSQVPKYTIILESGESILPSKKEVFQCIVSTSTKSTFGESLAAHSMMHHVAP